MSRKNMTPVECSKERAMEYVGQMVNQTHNFFKMAEKRYGAYHETFGAWKLRNPYHPLAKKNYPNDEYVEVISQWFNYFEDIYAEKDYVSLDI